MANREKAGAARALESGVVWLAIGAAARLLPSSRDPSKATHPSTLKRMIDDGRIEGRYRRSANGRKWWFVKAEDIRRLVEGTDLVKAEPKKAKAPESGGQKRARERFTRAKLAQVNGR